MPWLAVLSSRERVALAIQTFTLRGRSRERVRREAPDQSAAPQLRGLLSRIREFWSIATEQLARTDREEVGT